MSHDHDEPSAPPLSGVSRDRDPVQDRTSKLRLLPKQAHAAGDVIVGKYRLVSLLGEGGMGAVWRARSLALDIDVAVKVVHSDAATTDAAERLLREARAAASIGHPAIVRIFDFGVTDTDEPYLVMELLEGESLGDWLNREQRIAAGVAVQMLLPVISALMAAHAQGIVHRDIKPENIFIARGEGETRHPKLLDFGIVKFSQPRGGRVLTEVGMLMGSPEYMSPEQAEGRAEIDSRSDVWSVAVVLYELITGWRPFSGSHSGAVLISIFRDTPVPTTTLAAGDDELWSIIERGLQKRPSDRWDGMAELGEALGSWAVARGIDIDASGVSIARQWLSGSRTSLSGYTPQSAPARSTPPRTPGFETTERASTSALPPRSVTRSTSPGRIDSSPPIESRRATLMIAAAALALVAAVVALNLPKSSAIEAAVAAPSPSAATTTEIAPATPEPSVIAAPTSIIPTSAALPPAVAPRPPVRPAGSSKPSPRATKGSMPLPALPNF